MAGTIPTFALYGEAADPADADWVHCETIQARSRLHDYRIEPHRHENLLQMLHLASGRAELAIDGRNSGLSGPAIVAIPPKVVHGYTFSADVEGSVVTLFEHRLGRIAGASEEITKGFRDVQVVPLQDHAETARSVAADIASLVVEIAGRAEGRLRAIEARLTLIFLALRRFDGATARSARPDRRGLTHAKRFCDLVDRDFRSHLSVEAYAGKLGITSAHLNRVCRDHLGESALAVIHRRIIVEAKRYLIFTTLKAKDVAAALAFDDPTYFARFFRQRTGLTPVGFRNRMNARAE